LDESLPLCYTFRSLSYLHHFLCHHAVYLNEVDAWLYLGWFHNSPCDVKDFALFAFGQSQGAAEDGCGKELSCFNGVDNCSFLNANRPR